MKKILVSVNTDAVAFDYGEWPPHIPVPIPGDKVLFRVGDKTVGVTIEGRMFWTDGVDVKDGSPCCHFILTGKSTPQEHPGAE